MNHPQEPTRQALRGVEVEEWLNHRAPEGAFLQQTPRRTCAELGVCQQRTPACAGCNTAKKSPSPPPFTKWEARRRKAAHCMAFAISFQAWDLVGAVALVALAYFAAGYHG
jgi:hypothetical protein